MRIPLNRKYLLYKFRFYFNALRGLFGGTNRDAVLVKKEYGHAWGSANESNRMVANFRRPVLLYGRPAIQNLEGTYKLLAHEYNSVISSMQPDSVLEVGCGNGVNILALATLNPDVRKWEGLDFAPEGIKAARRYISEPPKDLAWIAGLRQETVSAKLMNASIKFSTGDMTKLPYENNSFDLVFTSLAVEQLRHKDALQAFRELHRVTKKYAFFYEGFRECNSILQILNRKRKGLFRWSIGDATRAGFKIISFQELPINKIIHQDGLLVCKKV